MLLRLWQRTHENRLTRAPGRPRVLYLAVTLRDGRRGGSTRPDSVRAAGRRARSEHRLRLTARGRVLLAGLPVALAVLVLALAGWHRSPAARVQRAPHVDRAVPASSLAAAHTVSVRVPAAPERARHRPSALALDTIKQGDLPQTPERPTGSTARFHEEMRALWSGIVRGSVSPAMPAFFPEGAYVQVKAIYGASSDWSYRLVHDFRLDVQAAHGLLGDRAASARLIAVDVPASFAHWVPPGVCYNRIGYWEMPNARVVYRLGGSEHSLGIASMIGWRGVWYVVHLGAVEGPGPGGYIDDPESGRGTSQDSGTC
jgi:hypothetical protein